MNVLITQREFTKGQLGKVSGLEESYVSFFESLNLTLYSFPINTKKVDEYLNNVPFSHIILTGGNDISPEMYGEKNQYLEDTSIERDSLEKKILTHAIKENIPVLGICRGMQFINVYFGGGLIQSIDKQIQQGIHAAGQNHKVKITTSKMESWNTTEHEVNSFHNQTVTTENLASHLAPFAVTEQADVTFIEGLYHTRYPVAGIQWHPERNNAPKELDKYLVNAFLNKELFWKSL